jgi:hypothetical protein
VLDAKDSPAIKENPLTDGYNHAEVWHFYDLAEPFRRAVSVSDGSLLAKWYEALDHFRSGVTNRTEFDQAGQNVQQAIVTVRSQIERLEQDPSAPAPGLAGPNSKFYRDLASSKSPFFVHNDAVSADQLLPEGRVKIMQVKNELADLKKNAPPPLPVALGLNEGGCPKTPHEGIHDVKVQIRGRHDREGETVPRGFLQVLAEEPQEPITNGSGRWQLAHWIANPKNPLTARVMVNRIWQHHFGEGIVRTPNNYGKQGEPPTHPELLDYLALRFIESGWSVKAMHRLMMLSSAYQQSSTPAPGAFEADPQNRLFGRMNRQRLEAEGIRDALLAATGNLDLAVGGPPFLEMTNNRRTIYLKTVRSDRSTFRALFDAGDPGAIVDKRINSTVAPQALFLLNNSFVWEQATALGKMVAAKTAMADCDRVQWLYERLYGRPASPEEVKIGLQDLYESRHDSGGAQGDAADLAWGQYCQILLCANEFIILD